MIALVVPDLQLRAMVILTAMLKMLDPTTLATASPHERSSTRRASGGNSLYYLNELHHGYGHQRTRCDQSPVWHRGWDCMEHFLQERHVDRCGLENQANYHRRPEPAISKQATGERRPHLRA